MSEQEILIRNFNYDTNQYEFGRQKIKKISPEKLDEIIEKTPLEKMLIETDCPYLTPPPMEGRNEPIYVRHVVEKIAKIKKKSYEEIAEITTKNAKSLFGL